MIGEFLSRFRVKYPNLEPKAREVISPEGEVISSHDPAGREVLDPVPMAPPVKLDRGMTQAEHVRRLVRNELSLAAVEEGEESFEEADDFDTGEDDDFPMTQYEREFDPEYLRLKDEALAQRQRERDEEKSGVKGRKPLPEEPKATEPEPKAPSSAKKPDQPADE